MIDLSPQLATTLTAGLGFAFTVAVLSYLVGDNVLYRLAIHLSIGASVGYVALITVNQVLLPRLVEPLSSGDTERMALASVPLVLFIFLTFKLSPRLADWGNIGIAVMLGVGTAIALAGALRGTLVPQIIATGLSLNPSPSLANNLVVVVGTVTTLAYFQFMVRANPGDGERGLPMRIIAGVGRIFIVITLGATYAGMILSGITLLSERLMFLWAYISRFLG